MKRFWGFVRKEWYHIFRDKRTLLILFGMPIAQIMLFGFAITNEIREAKVAVYDPQPDSYTRLLRNRLVASGYFQLDSLLRHAGEIEPVLRGGLVKQVLVFEAGFAEQLMREGQAAVQIVSDATDPNTAHTLQQYTTGIIRSFQQEMASPGTALPFMMQVEPRMRYNPELKGVFLFVPGLITIILMLVSTMMTSISITREKELGTMEVLLASPLRPAQIILGKVTPYVFLAVINAAVILVLGYFVFGVPMEGSLLLLALESVLFILVALALGILISTVAKTQQVALMVSLMALMLPTILLSGFLFPIDNMPLILQYISLIVPPRWFIVIAKGIMLKGVGLEVLWMETLILLGFAVVFMAVSVKKFQVRLA